MSHTRSRGRFTLAHAFVLAGVLAIPASAPPATQTPSGVPAASVRLASVQTAGVQKSVPSWGLDRIDQRRAKLTGSYTYPANGGAGVTAYVLDTGIRLDQKDLAGRVTSGWDFVDNDADATDCNGHGTHVAGTIGGTRYGVAKKVNLVAVRVLDCEGNGSYAGIIEGIDWVIANRNGPSVINMSLEGTASTAIDDAVRRAVAAGIPVVVAAGNHNVNACTESPARTPQAITVGAVGRNGARAPFSNYGRCVDLFAPGVNITSDWDTSPTARAVLSGTSMAAPHVAGVAALILASHPNYTAAQLRKALVTNATKGQVAKRGTGSPNLLLFG